MLIAALFTITKPQKQPKCPLTDVWEKKKNTWYNFTVEFYSAIKNNAIDNNMGETRDYNNK